MSQEDVVIGVVGDTSQLEKSLDNVAKQIARFSRAQTTNFENISEALSQVADAAKAMGSGVASGARQGTQELKKLEQQARKTANISIAGPSAPLGDQSVARVQAAMAGSTRQAQEQMTEEVRREAAERERISRFMTQQASNLQRVKRAQAEQTKETQRQTAELSKQEKLEAERIRKLAIARTLRIGNLVTSEDGKRTQTFVADISRVTPAIQSAVAVLPRLRYALFDAARGFAVLSAASAALVVAPAALAISYRREFADVQRTTGLAGAELEQLRQDFIKLKQDIPISWNEITDIGALAGQLGIAGNLIADFTASVARFAATTDLNVEQSATLFGRLNQLIDGVDGQFEKLSSSINKVGTISVATESQIGAIAQNIASIANQSGFAASEVIGLAGALASLGIAPELARGTVTRLFGNINRSVAVGGRNVEEFGRLTKRSAAEFADAWRTDASGALLDFFEGIQNEGPKAEKTLRDLGITSVRDVPAILRLAQNYGLVAELVSEAGLAFDEGLESQRQYNAITSTVAEQLRLLSQNFQLLIATIGDSSQALNLIIAPANKLVKLLTDLANNPVAKAFFGLSGIILLAVSGLAALAAIVAISIAKLSGLTTSIIDTNTALMGTAASAGSASAALSVYTKGVTAAIIGSERLKGFVFLSKMFLAIGAAVAVASAAYGVWAYTTRDATQRARDYFGEVSSFTEAVRADTEAHLEGADAIAVRRTAIEEDEVAIDEARRALRRWIGAQDDSEKATRKNTRAVRDQVVAFGESAFNIAVELTLDDEGFRQAARDPAIVALFEEAGVNFSDVISAAFDGDSTAEQFLTDLIEPIRQRFIELRGELDPFRAQDLMAGAIPITELEKDFVSAFRLFDDFTGLLKPLGRGLDDISESAAGTAASMRLLGDDAESALASLTSEDINQIINDIFGAENAARKTAEAVQDLGAAFAESGDEALFASEEIQSAITAILQEFQDPAEAVEQLIGLFAALASMGVDVTGPAMQFLASTIFEVGERADIATPKIAALISAAGGGDVPQAPKFLEQLSTGFDRVARSAGSASREVKSFADQMREAVDQMFAGINAAMDAEEAIFRLGESFAESGASALFASREMQAAIRAIVAASNDGEEVVANLSALLAMLSRQSGVTSASLAILRETIQTLGQQAGLSAERINQLMAAAGGGLATVRMNNFRRGVEAASRQVRTLLDFANDLSRVFTRAFDIRFSAMQNLDRISETWLGIRDRIADAEKSIREILITQRELAADRAIKEYFLSIAEAYGDTLRAAKLRAEIESIDEKMAENKLKIVEAEEEVSGALEGNSAVAIRNRQVLLSLISDYQSYITALASSGASQDELRRATEQARQEFIAQATELGFAEAQVLDYAKAFDDVVFAINRVPRNVTIEADVNPALTALREMEAQLERNIRAANDLNRALNQPVAARAPSGGSGSVPSAPDPKKQLQDQISSLTRQINDAITRRNQFQAAVRGMSGGATRNALLVEIDTLNRTISSLSQQRARLQAQLGSFAQGGFTGRGGKFQPAGIVHKGEFVVPKEFVNQRTGMPDMAFLAALQSGVRGYQQGGMVGASVNMPDAMMVELSPYDRKLLEQAGNVQLSLNGRVVAQATNTGNVVSAQRGSN